MRTLSIQNVLICAEPEEYTSIQRVLLTLAPDLGKLEKQFWLLEAKIENELDAKDLVIIDSASTRIGTDQLLQAVSEGVVFMQWMDHGALSIYHNGKFIEEGSVEGGNIVRFKKRRFKAFIPPKEDGDSESS